MKKIEVKGKDTTTITYTSDEWGRKVSASWETNKGKNGRWEYAYADSSERVSEARYFIGENENPDHTLNYEYKLDASGRLVEKKVYQQRGDAAPELIEDYFWEFDIFGKSLQGWIKKEGEADRFWQHLYKKQDRTRSVYQAGTPDDQLMNLYIDWENGPDGYAMSGFGWNTEPVKLPIWVEINYRHE